ncbi:MAG: hypothetical protein ACR2IE_17445 [Candidatus Sumerlaeaceae bacterium]
MLAASAQVSDPYPTVHGMPFQARWLPGMSVLLAMLLVIATGWVNDDAYITLRTIDNFIHGYGLRYNVEERVQAYTHPLWLILLTTIYNVVHSAYFTAVLAGVLCTLSALLLLVRSRPDPFTAALVVILASSKAFIEYSTSGLENSLSHLLIIAFFLSVLSENEKRRFAWACIWGGFAAVNRQDLALLFVGPLVIMAVQLRSAGAIIRGLLPGSLPLLLWESFSLIYYGFPFPNTAYAKLGAGLSRHEMLVHGFGYLKSSLARDYVTLPFTVFVCLLSPWMAKKPLAIGAGISIITYLAYIVWAGGDFMTGRFTTAPFVAAVALALVCTPTRWKKHCWKIAAVAGGLCLLSPGMVLKPVKAYSGPVEQHPYLDKNMVADERAFYSASSNLMDNLSSDRIARHPFAKLGIKARQRGARVIIFQNAGYAGYYAGPNLYILDPLALVDPLLARLPMRSDHEARQGHYMRAFPDGYKESLPDSTNAISNSNLHAFYDKIRIITRDPVWSRQRFVTIWQMNVGAFNSLVPRKEHYSGPKEAWHVIAHGSEKTS